MTPNFDFDKLKELIESKDIKNRKIGNEMFDRINEENEIVTFPFVENMIYCLTIRVSVTGYNDYGGEIKNLIEEKLVQYQDSMLRGTLIFNVLTHIESDRILYIDRNDICFVTIDLNVKQF